MRNVKEKVLQGEARNAMLDDVGLLGIGEICVVPHNLIVNILAEVHRHKYYIHLGATKMYWDLRQHYWWLRMKCGILDFLTKCKNCH